MKTLKKTKISKKNENFEINEAFKFWTKWPKLFVNKYLMKKNIYNFCSSFSFDQKILIDNRKYRIIDAKC